MLIQQEKLMSMIVQGKPGYLTVKIDLTTTDDKVELYSPKDSESLVVRVSDTMLVMFVKSTDIIAKNYTPPAGKRVYSVSADLGDLENGILYSVGVSGFSKTVKSVPEDYVLVKPIDDIVNIYRKFVASVLGFPTHEYLMLNNSGFKMEAYKINSESNQGKHLLQKHRGNSSKYVIATEKDGVHYFLSPSAIVVVITEKAKGVVVTRDNITTEYFGDKVVQVFTNPNSGKDVEKLDVKIDLNEALVNPHLRWLLLKIEV